MDVCESTILSYGGRSYSLESTLLVTYVDYLNDVVYFVLLIVDSSIIMAPALLGQRRVCPLSSDLRNLGDVAPVGCDLPI